MGPWVAQLSVPGPSGRRRYLRRSALTQRLAAVALDELKVEQRGGPTLTSRLSLGEYLRRWLDDSARASISANTYRGYDDVLAHLAPIASIPLTALTAEDIEECLNGMRTRRGHTPRPASPKTIRNAQVVLRRALGQAEARGHVRCNVARLIPLRKVPRANRPALTPGMGRQILDAVAGDRYQAAFSLALLGLREGEILGLAWSDVDLGAGRAELRYQLRGSGAMAVRAPLKTEASEAAVPLPAFVVDQLRGHRTRQLEERMAAGVVTEDGLVFVTARGLPVNPSWFTKHFQALLAAAGLPRMRLHDLRHGAASLLVGLGIHPRVVQELLRHASSRTTMDIYAHVSAGQQREAADALDRALRG